MRRLITRRPISRSEGPSEEISRQSRTLLVHRKVVIIGSLEVRMSAQTRSGCSSAMKCPPASGTLEKRRSLQTRSASWRGKGTLDGSRLRVTATGASISGWGSFVLVVEVGRERGADAARCPIEHDDAQQGVAADPIFEIAVMVHPVVEFVDYPGGQADRRIDKCCSDCVGPCEHDLAVAPLALVVTR